MRSNAKQVISLEPNHGTQGSDSNAASHLCHRDMLVRCIEAEDGIGIVGSTKPHLNESPSCCFAWTDRVVVKSIVVQDCIPLPIILVVNRDCDNIGLEYVLMVDLSGTSDSGAGRSVFAHSEEEEERQDD
jgi:hypothetical protein